MMILHTGGASRKGYTWITLRTRDAYVLVITRLHFHQFKMDEFWLSLTVDRTISIQMPIKQFIPWSKRNETLCSQPMHHCIVTIHQSLKKETMRLFGVWEKVGSFYESKDVFSSEGSILIMCENNSFIVLLQNYIPETNK